MEVMRQIRILKFWFGIINDPNSLKHKLFFMKDQNGNISNNWAKKVKNLIDNLGYSYLWYNEKITKLQLDNMIRSVHDQYYQQLFSDLRNSPKLDTYCLIKTTFETEKYLTKVTNVNHRIALTKFRCATHKLLIEEGRYRNIPREDRICIKCNMNEVETEYHFLLVCPFYRDIRHRILPKYYCHWPNMNKFKYLLKTLQSSTLRQLAKYIYEANVRRS